jgi:3-oxoadipate enol-lactonase
VPVDLHHEIAGPDDGPVLLLGNSLGSAMVMWEPQIAALTERWRVVRMDTRGHGRSPVPDGEYSLDDLGGDVVALLDRLGHQRVSYCGLSLGGMVGMWLAINAPQRIQSLVLCCTSAFLSARHNWQERIDAVLDAGSVEPIADAVIGRWLTAGFRDAHPDETAALRAMLVATPAAGYAGCCAAIRDMDLRDGLPRITAPTLVIAGADDEATPPAHGQLIAESIPGAEFQIVSPGAHFANVEAPDDVNRLILDHLEN